MDRNEKRSLDVEKNEINFNLKKWLKENKIYFETIFVVILGVASVIVSISQTELAHEQAKATELQLQLAKQNTYKVIVPQADSQTIIIEHYGEFLDVEYHDMLQINRWFKNGKKNDKVSEESLFYVKNGTNHERSPETYKEYHKIILERGEKKQERLENIKLMIKELSGDEFVSVSVRDSSFIKITRGDFLGIPESFVGRFLYSTSNWSVPGLFEHEYEHEITKLKSLPMLDFSKSDKEIVEQIMQADFL